MFVVEYGEKAGDEAKCGAKERPTFTRKLPVSWAIAFRSALLLLLMALDRSQWNSYQALPRELASSAVAAKFGAAAALLSANPAEDWVLAVRSGRESTLTHRRPQTPR